MKSNTDAGCVKPRCGSKLNGAARVDFGDVLRIVTSDPFLHLREHSLATKATFPSVAFVVLHLRLRSCWSTSWSRGPYFDILRIYFSGGFPVWTHGPFTSHHGNFRSEGSRGENMINFEKLRFSEKLVLKPPAGSKWGFKMPDFFLDGES